MYTKPTRPTHSRQHRSSTKLRRSLSDLAKEFIVVSKSKQVLSDREFFHHAESDGLPTDGLSLLQKVLLQKVLGMSLKATWQACGMSVLQQHASHAIDKHAMC